MKNQSWGTYSKYVKVNKIPSFELQDLVQSAFYSSMDCHKFIQKNSSRVRVFDLQFWNVKRVVFSFVS